MKITSVNYDFAFALEYLPKSGNRTQAGLGEWEFAFSPYAVQLGLLGTTERRLSSTITRQICGSI
jgi:hypothetical protein